MPLLGGRLRKARISKGMSQRELADKLGLTQAAICQFEKGQRSPTPQNVRNLANILDIDLVDLAGDDEGGFERAILLRNLRGLSPETISKINEIVETYRKAEMAVVERS